MRLRLWPLLLVLGCAPGAQHGPGADAPPSLTTAASSSSKVYRLTPSGLELPTFYQVSPDPDVEPVILGPTVLVRHLRDGMALAELRGDRFVVDPQLAKGLAHCSVEPDWAFYGSFPNAAFALVDWVPRSKLDRGRLLRFENGAWQRYDEVMARDGLLTERDGEPLLLIAPLSTPPPQGYDFEGYGFVPRNMALSQPVTMLADADQVLVVDQEMDGTLVAMLARANSDGPLSWPVFTPASVAAPRHELSAHTERFPDSVWLALVDAAGTTQLVHTEHQSSAIADTLPGRVVSMALGSAADLWLVAVGTRSRLLHRTKAGQIEEVPLAPEIGAPRKVWVDTQGVVWLAADGLYRSTPVPEVLHWQVTSCEPQPPDPELSRLFAQGCVDDVFADAESRARKRFGARAKLDESETLSPLDLDEDRVSDTRVTIRLGPVDIASAVYHYREGCSRFVGLLRGFPAADPDRNKSHGLVDLRISDTCETCCSVLKGMRYRFDGESYRAAGTTREYRNCDESL